MNVHPLSAINPEPSRTVSRRATVRRLIVGSTAAIAAGRGAGGVAAQDAPVAGACVATAPAAQDGIGLASLLVGCLVPDMPAGPVEVRITRFTLAPDAGVPPAAMPYPSLMVIETGESSCPGDAGKISYGADGTVLGTSNGTDPHLCLTGSTWYIPAGLADGADNLGTELMSSLVIEFVPVETAAAGEGTPVS